MAGYLNEKEIRRAFAEHLMKYRGYSEEEAGLIVSDFPDVYSNFYLESRVLESNVQIGGDRYEKTAAWTVFWKMGMDDVPMFRFYIYYREDDIEDKTVGSYMNASKWYQTDGLDPADFPEEHFS